MIWYEGWFILDYLDEVRQTWNKLIKKEPRTFLIRCIFLVMGFPRGTYRSMGKGKEKEKGKEKAQESKIKK